jgi:hypothetical protein
MKTLLTICALAAGAGLTATTTAAQADHCRGYRGGYLYSAPVFNGGHAYRGHRHYDRFDRGYYGPGRFDRGFGYNRGFSDRRFYGRRGGFAIQTPGFGLYIR